MTEQQWTVIADRDKGDNMVPPRDGDRVTYGRNGWGQVVGIRIERPVPTTDEVLKSTGTGGVLVRELDDWAERTDDANLRSLLNRAGDHIEFIETDAHYAPHPPTHTQIAEAIREVYAARDWMEDRHEFAADAVLALIQNGADR